MPTGSCNLEIVSANQFFCPNCLVRTLSTRKSSESRIRALQGEGEDETMKARRPGWADPCLEARPNLRRAEEKFLANARFDNHGAIDEYA